MALEADRFIRIAQSLSALTAMLAFAFSGAAMAAQPGSAPLSHSAGVRAVADLPVAALPAVNQAERLAEDAANTKPGPLRYAIPVDVSVTPDNAGTWEKLDDGERLWRYRMRAPGATDLNFGFTRYHLPPGATLHVISEAQHYYHGPYTSKDNMVHGQHWTPMVPGDSAVIELYLPAGFNPDATGAGRLELELGRVGTGYRDLFGVPNLRQGACNIDTICPQGDNWRDEIRSAAMYSLGGGYFCSGTIIMDVPGSFIPFWLTANHCGLNAGNAASLVILWNFESPVCGALSGGIASDVQTGGAVWRAARSDVDFTLLELLTLPDPAFNVHYSGWDATGSVPVSSVGISHPSTDEKALAFNDDALTTTASCIGSTTPGTHWNVDNYELGMTEPGSSGSGIWNPYSTDPFTPIGTPKLVGILSGGSAACAGSVPNTGFDCYGKFSVSWNGTSPSARLRDWLDPAGTGTLMVDGADPTPATCGDGALGGGEQCDDGDLDDGDGCSSSCQIEPGWTCTNPPAQPSVCTLIECGNGVIETGEQCDDGNASDGDGCSSACEVEDGYSCDGEPSVCMLIPEGCSQPGVPIPDNNPAGVSDSLSLSGGILTDLDLEIVTTHTWVGDLIYRLEHVDTGTSVVVIDRPGLPLINATFGCDADNIDVTLDDAAATSVEDQCSAGSPGIGGTHMPNNPLAAFNGESAAGTWTLTVSDNAGADLGTFDEWCLLPTVSGVDSDGDGVNDDTDNCTDVANPDQYDSNGDNIGSLCDADITGPGGIEDCTVNFVDLQALKDAFFANPAQPQWNPDADFDNSGLINFSDLQVLKDQLFGPPGPSAAGCN